VDDTILIAAVLLLTASQLLQKLSARRMADATGFAHGIRALMSIELAGAVICIVLGTLLWLVALYRMDVGRAFPFLSLSSVLVVAISRVFLKEEVPVHRWVGVAFICLGIALVSRT
jgi:undecaprenyl phosphate-alpha-L-ara4N flippase subunit ArnE